MGCGVEERLGMILWPGCCGFGSVGRLVVAPPPSLALRPTLNTLD